MPHRNIKNIVFSLSTGLNFIFSIRVPMGGRCNSHDGWAIEKEPNMGKVDLWRKQHRSSLYKLYTGVYGNRQIAGCGAHLPHALPSQTRLPYLGIQELHIQLNRENACMLLCCQRLQYLSIGHAPWQGIDKTPLIYSEDFTYPSVRLPCVILIMTSTVSRTSTTAPSHPHHSPWASLRGPSSSPSKNIPALPPQRTQSL